MTTNEQHARVITMAAVSDLPRWYEYLAARKVHTHDEHKWLPVAMALIREGLNRWWLLDGIMEQQQNLLADATMQYENNYTHMNKRLREDLERLQYELDKAWRAGQIHDGSRLARVQQAIEAWLKIDIPEDMLRHTEQQMKDLVGELYEEIEEVREKAAEDKARYEREEDAYLEENSRLRDKVMILEGTGTPKKTNTDTEETKAALEKLRKEHEALSAHYAEATAALQDHQAAVTDVISANSPVTKITIQKYVDRINDLEEELAVLKRAAAGMPKRTRKGRQQ